VEPISSRLICLYGADRENFTLFTVFSHLDS
jgi:hypothetical protein